MKNIEFSQEAVEEGDHLGTTNWSNTSTINPFTKAKRSLLGGFVSRVQIWEEEGKITLEEKEEILNALDDPETQACLDISLQQNIMGSVLRSEIFAALGVFISGDISGAALGEAVRMAIKNVHARFVGRNIPPLKRELIAASTMPPVVGAQMPLLFLHKKYPKLYKYFRLYLTGRKLFNITDRQGDGEKPFTPKEQRVLKRFGSGGNEITPSNIIAAQERLFEQWKEKLGL